MALKSRTPLNTSALRRDFSALPQIAKIKADANMQMLNTIKSGLEKRKEKIEEKQKKELNIKLLKDIIEADTENRLVPPGVDAKELAKYIPLEETLRYRQTLDAINKEIQKERDRVKAGKSAAKAIGLPKRVGGLFPEAVVGGAIKDAITPVPSTPRPATSIQEYEFYKQSKEESGETPVGFKEFLESKSGPGTVINTGQGSLGRFSDKLSEAGAKEVFDSKKKAQDT